MVLRLTIHDAVSVAILLLCLFLCYLFRGTLCPSRLPKKYLTAFTSTAQLRTPCCFAQKLIPFQITFFSGISVFRTRWFEIKSCRYLMRLRHSAGCCSECRVRTVRCDCVMQSRCQWLHCVWLPRPRYDSLLTFAGTRSLCSTLLHYGWTDQDPLWGEYSSLVEPTDRGSWFHHSQRRQSCELATYLTIGWSERLETWCARVGHGRQGGGHVTTFKFWDLQHISVMAEDRDSNFMHMLKDGGTNQNYAQVGQRGSGAGLCDLLLTSDTAEARDSSMCSVCSAFNDPL